MSAITTTTPHHTVRTVDSVGAETATAPPRYAPATGLLPLPTRAGCGDDMLAALSALLTRASNDERKSAKQREATELASQRMADDAQVASLHQKADEIRSKGLVSGLAKIGAGVLSIAGAGASFASASAKSAADEAGRAAAKLEAAAEGAGAAWTKLQDSAAATSRAWDLAKGGIDGARDGALATGDILAAHSEGEGEDRSTDALVHSQVSALHARLAKTASDDAGVARDDVVKTLTFLKEMRQAEADAARTAASMLRGDG